MVSPPEAGAFWTILWQPAFSSGGRQSPVSPPPFPLAAVALALLPPGRSELDVVPLITLGTQALTLTGDYGLVTESGLQAPGRLSSGQAS